MGEKFGLGEPWRSPTRSLRAPQSIVFDEAENRMHTIKAVMYDVYEVTCHADEDRA